PTARARWETSDWKNSCPVARAVPSTIARRADTSSSPGRGTAGRSLGSKAFTRAPPSSGSLPAGTWRQPGVTLGATTASKHRGSSDDSTRRGRAMLEQQTAEGTGRRSRAPGGAWLIPWAAQVVVAVILAQTLFFKFTYAPETQVIFQDRGGRPAATAVGVIELVCVVLLLVPRTAAAGALLSLLTISGAIFTHLTSLGISIPSAPGSEEKDGGTLFFLALVVAFGSALVLRFRWKELPDLGRLAVSRSRPNSL